MAQVEMEYASGGSGNAYTEQFSFTTLNEVKTLSLPFTPSKFYISWIYTGQYISVDYDKARNTNKVLITLPPNTIVEQDIGGVNFVQSVNGNNVGLKAGASNQVGYTMTLIACK